MKTEHEFADVLKTMMSEMSLDDISVTLLCEKCHVNRKTFYYHFHDIYDLLTLVFLDETIPHIHDSKNLSDMIKIIFKYYSKNAKFLDATISSAGKDLFQEFIYNNCYQTILKFVNETPNNKKLVAADRKAIARFYALGYSNAITYYLSSTKTKTLAGLMTSFCFINNQNLSESVNNFIAIRSKK